MLYANCLQRSEERFALGLWRNQLNFRKKLIVDDALAIKHRFSKSSKTYQTRAGIQRQVAQTLASFVDGQPKKILEIGCGTGLLTAQLIKRAPGATLTATDMSGEMLTIAHSNLSKESTAVLPNFELLNPEIEPIKEKYDLIVASMVVHWFQNPLETIKTIRKALTDNGQFYFSTIGPDCFKEWQQALSENGLPSGLRIPPPLPGLFEQEYKSVAYESAQNFLYHLKATGAHRPRSNYTPLSLSQLKRAMLSLEQGYKANLTWHITYGRLKGDHF